MLQCPIDGCPTMLQPYKAPPTGGLTPLEAGVAAHLAMVHQLPGPAADQSAREYVAATVRGGEPR